MQSVLVLPLVVPPVAETAANAVPQLDGGFLAAFAEDRSRVPEAIDTKDSAAAMVPLLPWPLPVVPAGLRCAAGAGRDMESAAPVAVEGGTDSAPTMMAVPGVAIAKVTEAVPVGPNVVGAVSPPAGPTGRNEAAEEPKLLEVSRSDVALRKGLALQPVPDKAGATIAAVLPVEQPVVAAVSAEPQSVAGRKAVSLPGSADGNEMRKKAELQREPYVASQQVLEQGLKADTEALPKDVAEGREYGPLVPPSASNDVVEMAAGVNLGLSSAPLAEEPVTGSTPVRGNGGLELNGVEPLLVSGMHVLPRERAGGVRDLPATGTPPSSVAALEIPDRTDGVEPASSDDQPGADRPLRAQVLSDAAMTRPPVAGFWERLFSGLTAESAPSEKPLVEVKDGSELVQRPSVGEVESQPADPLKPLVTNLIPTHTPEPITLAKELVGTPDPLAHLQDDDGPDAALAVGPLTSAASPVSVQIGPSVSNSPPIPHIAGQIAAALTRSEDGATELALSPEELGHVRLRLERDAKHPDRMVVMITFERPETLDLFRRHAGELADALRAAGYAGADIGFGQQGSGSQGADRNPGAPAFGADYDPGATLIAEAAPNPASARRPLAGASLDLRL
ncbi:MAG: flagellar hook-length control protein FliK [Tabrizicola sp.]